MEQYKILKIIGQGAFGNAYLARQLEQDKDYVIKKIELTNKNKEQTETIFKEVTLLQAFKHVNIVSYRESIIEGQDLNIIMEFCSGGDLNQLIVEQKETHGGRKLDESQIIDWATQIALAIFYMHDKRILHRDLKTPNIFITDDRVKLGDFGISKVLDEKVDLANTSIGTPYYMSPEQYRHKPYSYKSDIWAFGCIIFEMCNQKRPFEAYSLHGLAVKVLEANVAPVSQFYSKQLRELVKKMLQKKQKDRPSILQFLQTPIIRKRSLAYLKEVHDKLVGENGDKVLIEGVLYQAKKLGLSLQDKPEFQLKKSKPEFSAEKKKQEKERIRQQLEEQLKKISEKNKKEKQELKRLEENRKNILKGNTHRSASTSTKKHSIASSNSTSSKSLKDPSIMEVQRSANDDRAERAKRFKMEEQYDFYDMEYEQEESDQDSKFEVIPEDEEEEDKHEGKTVTVKAYEKEKYTKVTQQLKKSQKAKFTQLSDPPKLQSDVPIEEAITSLKQSVKINNQKLYTIKNELSNMDIDLEISSSEDELEKVIDKPQNFPSMKKPKQKNPAYALITDKINDLRQSLQLVIGQDTIRKLLSLAEQKKSNPTRTQIEKIAGKHFGTYHLAYEIVKLSTLLEKIPPCIKQQQKQLRQP